MTIWSILGWIMHWAGFIQFGEALFEKHEAVKKSRAIASSPVTNQEWTDAANHGDL